MADIATILDIRTTERAALQALEASIRTALQAHVPGEPLPVDLAATAETLLLGTGIEALRLLHGQVGAELNRTRLIVAALEAEAAA